MKVESLNFELIFTIYFQTAEIKKNFVNVQIFMNLTVCVPPLKHSIDPCLSAH